LILLLQGKPCLLDFVHPAPVGILNQQDLIAFPSRHFPRVTRLADSSGTKMSFYQFEIFISQK